MKPLKEDQQLGSVSLLYSVTLPALKPKSSPRRRRGLDASTDRALTERSGEVFFLDILSHRMSVIAFHEKAGRSQGDSFWYLLVMLFFPRRVATVDPLAPSRCDASPDTATADQSAPTEPRFAHPADRPSFDSLRSSARCGHAPRSPHAPPRSAIGSPRANASRLQCDPAARHAAEHAL